MIHGPAIQRTRDPNNGGDRGARNVKARVAVFKNLWKFLKIFSVIITKIMKSIFVLFNHLDNQRYTISKKKLIEKESWFGDQETVDGMVYITVYTF